MGEIENGEAMHISAADVLVQALRDLNGLECIHPNPYGHDNTWRVVRDEERDLSPYAHVRAAALAALAPLCGGYPERAEELLGQSFDNGEGVAYNLPLVRARWRDECAWCDQPATEIVHDGGTLTCLPCARENFTNWRSRTSALNPSTRRQYFK